MCKRGDNIHKRKDGRWEGRYLKCRRDDGKIRYGSVYGRTYRDVKQKMTMAKQAPPPAQPQRANEKTFSEVLDLWMDSNRIRLKGGTINKYQRVIEAQIKPELGNIKMSQITSARINAFLLDKLQDGRLDKQGALSASYVKTITLIITATIKYATREQLCQPLRSPINKPTEQRQELTVLDISEQKRLETYLLHNISPTSIGILLSLYIGLRIGEVCALRWDDIDFARQIIYVRHTVARVQSIDEAYFRTCLIIDTPKTKTSQREIPIPSLLLNTLINFKEVSDSDYIVSNKPGFISPRTYEYRYHKALEASGVRPVNYHVLRHTFATRCVEAGVDIKSLSEILGHANVGITLNTYVHSSMELKRSQLEKMVLVNA